MRLAELLFSWSQLQIAGVSLLVSVAIVLLSPKIRFLATRADDTTAVQATHIRQTPRLGGVAIFAAFALTVLWAPLEISDNYTKFFSATCLLFIVGLSEDLGFHVSPRNRLLAAIGASGVAIFLLGVWLPRIGIPGLDPWMSAWWIGPPLTLLLTAGIANGFNLIDGVNGLSGLTAIVALVALAGISDAGNYDVMVQLALMMAACILGFWVINFPMGFIFLGDAGAYVLGFIISWFGIAVLLNVANASPWAILLTVYWPVADTLLAIYRRLRRDGDVSAPDRLHVHQMVMRALEICFLGRARRRVANPLTTIVLSPFVIMPPLTGVIFWNENGMAFAAALGFSVLFFVSYIAVPKFVSRFRM